MSIAIPKEDFFPIEDKNKRNKDDLFRHMNWLHEYRIYAINGSLKHMVWYAQELMTDGQVEESLKWFMTALHYGSDIAANILDGELASLGIRRGRIVWEYDEKIAFSLLERARLGNVEARFYVWESISRLHNKNTCIRVRENLISIYSDYLEYSTLYSIEDNCFVFTSFKLINSERYYNFIKDISSDRAEKFPVTLSAKKELHEFEKERDLKEMRERNKFEQLIISYKAMTDELSNQNTICWICKKNVGEIDLGKKYNLCSPTHGLGKDKIFSVIDVSVPRCKECFTAEVAKRAAREKYDTIMDNKRARWERVTKLGCIMLIVLACISAILMVYACLWGVFAALLTYIGFKVWNTKIPERGVYPDDIVAYDEHKDWDYPPIDFLLKKGFNFGKAPPEPRF